MRAGPVRVAGVGGVGAVGVGGANLPAEGAELLSLAQELTEPRLLVCRVVGVMAQIAAAHVGFAPVIAEAIGRLAASVASRLTEAEPESPGMRALQYADVTFSAAGELTEYLGVGRVEVRSEAAAAQRLWDLDRDQPARRGGVVDGRGRAFPVPGQRPGRAARGPLPGVSRAIRAEPPGVRRAARTDLPGVRRSGMYRRVPPYPPGRHNVPGRGELGGPGEPPGRGGPPAR